MFTFPIATKSGIQRDNTSLASANYTDGLWCRFYGGKPQKMGGYTQVNGMYPEIVRGTYVVPVDVFGPSFDVYNGSESYVQVFNFAGVAGGALVDRTPGAGFVVNANNVWQFDQMTQLAAAPVPGQYILAYAGQNLVDINNQVETNIFYGSINNTTALTAIAGVACSGGICVVGDTLFIYGNGGKVKWSVPGDFSDFTSTGSGTAIIANQKVVKAVPIRSGNSAGALFFTLNSVERGTFTPSVGWTFSTVSKEASILSAQTVIEMDGIIYWVAKDRFMMYNGVVQEVDNDMNLQFFFNNLVKNQSGKVWATKIPMYGEWWIHFVNNNYNVNPDTDATFDNECNYAIVYNSKKKEKTWYDTASYRSSGFYDQVLKYPVMVDSRAQTFNGPLYLYSTYIHEIGVNEVLSVPVKGEAPIQSSFTTNWFYVFDVKTKTGQRGTNIKLDSIWPDFAMTESMSCVAGTKRYPNSPEVLTVLGNFDSTTEKLDTLLNATFLRLQFESNVLYGSYLMGNTMVVGEGFYTIPGDVRR